MQEISVESIRIKSGVSVEEAILNRRSARKFKATGLTMEETSQLLWAGQGITDPVRGFRASPSAGATYPLETYLVNSSGVYSFAPEKHRLVPVKSGDMRSSLSRAALGQGFIELAPASFIIAAVYPRTARRYGAERGFRYVHIETGHAAQNIHLQAVALGLGSVPVGAFREDEVKRVLSLPDGREPVYIIPVGHPSE